MGCDRGPAGRPHFFNLHVQKRDAGLVNSSTKWAEDRLACSTHILLIHCQSLPVGPDQSRSPYKCCIGRGLAAIRILENSPKPQLSMLVHTPYATRSASREGKGGTQRNISQTVIRSFPFVLAPLPEQHRIVAKLDELFSELDAGVAALERAQAKLKRYRASVLKAAVEGRLTEEWRRKNPPDETGAELLTADSG